MAVRAGVKEAYLAAIQACAERGQTHLVCCMVSGGIYTDQKVHDNLFGAELGYADILSEIFVQHKELKEKVTCVLANFYKQLNAMVPLVETLGGNPLIKDGDSISVACQIQDEVEGAKVCIMIAGNAGRPFGALGKMDRTGLAHLPPYRTYKTQEESVLASWLSAAANITTIPGDADVLYNYYINGNEELDQHRKFYEVQRDLITRFRGYSPQLMADVRIPLPTRTLVHPDMGTPISPYTGSSPWGMEDTGATSTTVATKQGHNYVHGVPNGVSAPRPTFDASAYRFCLLIEQCFVQDAKAKLREVSFAFVFGPNTDSRGTTQEGAQRRTLVKMFNGNRQGGGGKKSFAGGRGAKGTKGQYQTIDLV